MSFAQKLSIPLLQVSQKLFDRIIAISPAIITQSPLVPVGNTFTFKGQFDDVNFKQSFRVYFTDGTFYDFGLCWYNPKPTAAIVGLQLSPAAKRTNNI